MTHVSWRQFTRDPKIRSAIFKNGDSIVVEEVKGNGSFIVAPFQAPFDEKSSRKKLSWRGCLKQYDDGDDDIMKLWLDSIDD